MSALAALAVPHLPCPCEDCGGNPENAGRDFHDFDLSSCRPRDERGQGLVCGRCKGERVLLCEGMTTRGGCDAPAVTTREENGTGDFCTACAPEPMYPVLREFLTTQFGITTARIEETR